MYMEEQDRFNTFVDGGGLKRLMYAFPASHVTPIYNEWLAKSGHTHLQVSGSKMPWLLKGCDSLEIVGKSNGGSKPNLYWHIVI